MSDSVERRGRLSSSSRHIIKHNLSGNKYGKYILRQNLENKIVNFLKNDNENYQVISGLGGMGKSSLIFSVLSKVINGDIDLGKTVDSIIWVTDSYNPGDLDISKLVDEINAVYGTTVSSTHEIDIFKEAREKARKNLNMTSRNMISILVVDNFETVNDDELRKFIFELPQTCKVILTSKINRDKCIQSGIIIMQNSQCINDLPIPKFEKKEWYTLYSTIYSTVDKIRNWADSFSDYDKLNQIIDVIYDALGGVPFPFERILTQIADNRLKDVSKIKKLIYKAIRQSKGYDRMIKYSWDQLKKSSRTVLIAAALSGYLSTLNFKQISEISGLETYDTDDEYAPEIDSNLEEAIEECLNYNLIGKDTSDETVRYYLPAIVYRYIINIVMSNSETSSASFENEFIDVIRNWINYYKRITQNVGMCYNRTEIMQVFDSVQQKEAFEFVLDYCYKNALYHDFIVISNNMRYFCYTRGIWDKGDKCVHIKRAKSAEMIGDYLSELEAYVYYINIASKYRQFDEVPEYLTRVEQIVSDKNIIVSNPDAYFRYKHTLGLFYYHKDLFSDARNIWETILSEPLMTNNEHDIDAARRWYIKCLNREEGIEEDIKNKIITLLQEAKEHKFERAIIDYTLTLIRIYAQQNSHDRAKERLSDTEMIQLIEKTNDVLYKAKYYLWCAFYSNGNERATYIEKAKMLVNANVLNNIIRKDIFIMNSEFSGLFE